MKYTARGKQRGWDLQLLSNGSFGDCWQWCFFTSVTEGHL